VIIFSEYNGPNRAHKLYLFDHAISIDYVSRHQHSKEQHLFTSSIRVASSYLALCFGHGRLTAPPARHYIYSAFHHICFLFRREKEMRSYYEQ